MSQLSDSVLNEELLQNKALI